MTKTLKPNSAFLAFGRLFSKVGAFEEFMRVALMEKEIQSGKLAKLDTGQRAAWERRFSRLDFAQLEQRICDQFKLTGDDRAVMKDARIFRNDLSHSFWQTNFVNLHSDRGIFLVEQQCLQLELQFDVLSEHLIKLTGANVPDYVAWIKAKGVEGKHLADLERLIGEGWQAHLDAGHIAHPDASTAE